jgi:hypothetical protein
MRPPHLQRIGKIPASTHPYDKDKVIAQPIQHSHKEEELCFPEITSIDYGHWIQCLHSFLSSTLFWV